MGSAHFKQRCQWGLWKAAANDMFKHAYVLQGGPDYGKSTIVSKD